MKVLVACEFSGVVRRAFEARGHFAWSVDLLPAEDGAANHYQGGVMEYLSRRSTPLFDLLIAHPPCTHLAVSGARWFKEKRAEQENAAAFAAWLLGDFVNIPRKCIENPVSILSSRLRRPDQIIQPHQFGHPEFKATCLWLKNLPPLAHTSALELPLKGTPEHRAWSKVHRAAPGPDRWKERSRTFTGIADAMAEQWGVLSPIERYRMVPAVRAA